MSNLTDFFNVANLDVAVTTRAPASSALSGAVKSIQTGYVNAAFNNGSGEDVKYYDVTISSVTPSKCLLVWHSYPDDIDSIRMTSSTNLRIAAASSSLGYATGRYYVVEFY